MRYPSRMPRLYHSDLHQPRWKRLVLWCLEDEVGRNLSGAVAMFALIAPIWLAGWWWAAVLAALISGFYLGRWTMTTPD
jgi:hypothetical protein